MPRVRKHPGHRGPGPRPARPGRVEPARQQRRDGEGEGHREADIAHVQHRRMDDHARVLQQRVQVAAVGRRREQALERVGGEQHEQQEAAADQAHDAEHARHHAIVGSWRENSATASVQPARISTHSSIEPSWLPQTAAMR